MNCIIMVLLKIWIIPMRLLKKILNFIKNNSYKLKTTKGKIFIFLIVAMTASIIYLITNMAYKNDDIYLQKEGDYLVNINAKELNNIDKFIVVRAKVFGYNDVFIKYKNDKKVQVFTDVNDEAFEFFQKNTLTPYLEGHKDFPVRYMSSLEGISERLGVASDPDDMIRSKKIDSFAKVFIAILTQVAIIGLVLWLFIKLQGGSLTSSISCVKPKDIRDSLAELIGMDDIIAEFMQIAHRFENQGLYRKFNIDEPFNILLTGPAGVGKTKIVRCMAKVLNVPLYYLSAASLQSGYVGGGSRALKNLAKAAGSNHRAIIFIDEAESLLQNRTSGAQHWEKETINTLLSLLDGVNSKKNDVIWILATNMNSSNTDMDKAMLRRFPLEINFRLPNFEVRKKILQSLISKVDTNLVAKGVDLNQIAAVTANMSPALLQNLVNRASAIAIQSDSVLNQNILMRAFERVAIGLTDRDTTKDQYQSRLLISRHEVGHFLVKMEHALKQSDGDLSKLPVNLNVLKISTESVSSVGALGFVLSKDSDNKLFSRDHMENLVEQLYGGMANEEIYYGKSGVTSGAIDDIRKATQILKTMVCEARLYSDAKFNLSDNEIVMNSQVLEVESLSIRLYSQAITTLKKYAVLSDILVETLMKEYVLTVEDALVIIENHFENSDALVSTCA